MKRYMVILVFGLMGCLHRVQVAAETRSTLDYPPLPEPPPTHGPEGRRIGTITVQPKTWTPCPQCEDKRARLAVAEKELEIAEAEREEYVKNHCKGTLKYETKVFRSGGSVSGAPERAWICDGRLVDVPETLKEQILVGQIGDLNDWIRDNCVDTGPRSMLEKRCP